MTLQNTLLRLEEHKKTGKSPLSPELLELEQTLKTTLATFKEKRNYLLRTGKMPEGEERMQIEEQESVIKEMCSKIMILLSPLESLLHIKESYETQVSRYRSLGWLVQKDGKEGIIGLDKNFYLLPSLDEVQEALSEKAELLTYKHAQGFKKFMLVPFGMSYMEMYNKLETEYKRYAKAPKKDKLGLYRTNSARTKLTKIDNVPYISDAMKKETELRYYPETLYSDDPKVHQAKTKAELIADSTTRFPGWELHLLPENPLLAREGKGEKISDRPAFEANIRFGDYLDKMKGREGTKDKKVQPVTDAEGQNVYRGEAGLIPEVWAAWALEELYTKNQVLHDWNSEQDTGVVLIGTLTKKNNVAVSYFDQYDDRVFLDVRYTDGRNGFYAGASSVKVC